MELLVVPFIVSLATVVFTFVLTQQQNLEERRAQQVLENQRAEFSVFQEYLDNMRTLLIQERLRTSEPSDDVTLVARAHTLSALQTLGPERKALLLEFMFETELLQFRSHDRPPVISLRFADLSEINLVGRSMLSNTDLDRAELTDAKLDNAMLINTTLTKADLRGANLSGTDLSGADLSGADLRGAKSWTEEQLREAESLQGATMPDSQTLKSEDNPDGPTLKEWLKSKRRGEDEENGSP